jgi:hypothetical protein
MSNMQIEDFVTNFAVTVVDYDDTNYNIAVKFMVLCIPNERVSVHTTTVDARSMSEGYTQDNILDTAWLNVKETVNTWAMNNILNDKLTTIIAPSGNWRISTQLLNDNFTIKVIRFEIVPKEKPTNWCIGFNITMKGNTSMEFYIEGSVPISGYCNNIVCMDIVNAVWETVKDKICTWAGERIQHSEVLNTPYVPTTL